MKEFPLYLHPAKSPPFFLPPLSVHLSHHPSFVLHFSPNSSHLSAKLSCSLLLYPQTPFCLHLPLPPRPPPLCSAGVVGQLHILVFFHRRWMHVAVETRQTYRRCNFHNQTVFRSQLLKHQLSVACVPAPGGVLFTPQGANDASFKRCTTNTLSSACADTLLWFGRYRRSCEPTAYKRHIQSVITVLYHLLFLFLF